MNAGATRRFPFAPLCLAALLAVLAVYMLSVRMIGPKPVTFTDSSSGPAVSDDVLAAENQITARNENAGLGGAWWADLGNGFIISGAKSHGDRCSYDYRHNGASLLPDGPAKMDDCRSIASLLDDLEGLIDTLEQNGVNTQPLKNFVNRYRPETYPVPAY